MAVITYKVKDVGKTADDYRREIEEIVKAPCFVEVHPGLLRVRISVKPSEEALRKLDKYIREEADGVRIG